MYFLAGLLPDPDGPWTPTASHHFVWIVGMLIEVFTASMFIFQQQQIDMPRGLLESLFGLSSARIVILAIMITLLFCREYKFGVPKHASGSESERQSLLENGNHASPIDNGSDGYKSKPKRLRDAQSAGWFDYFAGFRVLFPYLWWVSELEALGKIDGWRISSI